MKYIENTSYEEVSAEIRELLSGQAGGYRLSCLVHEDGSYELAERIEGAEFWEITPDEEYSLEEAVTCLSETACEYLDECFGILVDTGMV